MRERNPGQSLPFSVIDREHKAAALSADRKVPYDEARFFESFYTSSVRRGVSDRTTIGNEFSLIASRFHYNATENSIIKAMARRAPPAHGAVVAGAETKARLKKMRMLDIGAGTGHWTDFFRDVFLVADSTCVEITNLMADYLRQKYAGDDKVRVLQQDICEPEFTTDLIGGPVDYICAIGVMFHIVDDDRWQLALDKLAAMLKPEGLLVIGGDFGHQTRNVQFHKTDDFASWHEYAHAAAPEGEIRVNKRIRSLADWNRAAAHAGLVISDLVRTDSFDTICTPENDILLLAKA